MKGRAKLTRYCRSVSEPTTAAPCRPSALPKVYEARKHAILETRGNHGAGARRALDADAVRFVDDQRRAVALGQFDDFRERRRIAIHRVNALDADHDVTLGVLQPGFQTVEIVVPKAQVTRLAKLHAIEDAGVDQSVGDQRIAAAEKAGKERNIRGDNRC